MNERCRTGCGYRHPVCENDKRPRRSWKGRRARRGGIRHSPEAAAILKRGPRFEAIETGMSARQKGSGIGVDPHCTGGRFIP
ncbi:hypothetical protein HMPREF9440_02129 [Sutterella parvirubra YIT 11816]|uniref:Uncharacterized protein n=1 Tax=Sutterella parvirubra YIT 11816 TaxID=762967 RepID=H3KH88_9BURK|nr:hypothetical protein HMPREF9440_02129 [Sutterella parvirubra YIT 11816]